jgi:hypothetical protein
LVITRITPSLWWLAIVEVQLAGRASPCRTEETAIDPAEDLDRPGAVQADEHQVDEAGAAAQPRSGSGILVPVKKLLHPGAGGRRDVWAAIHHLRHSGQRNACLGCDGGERGLPHGLTFRIKFETYR